MEPLPTLFVLGCVHAPVGRLIREGYMRIQAQAVSFGGKCFYLLATTAQCSYKESLVFSSLGKRGVHRKCKHVVTHLNIYVIMTNVLQVFLVDSGY